MHAQLFGSRKRSHQATPTAESVGSLDQSFLPSLSAKRNSVAVEPIYVHQVPDKQIIMTTRTKDPFQRKRNSQSLKMTYAFHDNEHPPVHYPTAEEIENRKLDMFAQAPTPEVKYMRDSKLVAQSFGPGTNIDS